MKDDPYSAALVKGVQWQWVMAVVVVDSTDPVNGRPGLVQWQPSGGLSANCFLIRSRLAEHYYTYLITSHFILLNDLICLYLEILQVF